MVLKRLLGPALFDWDQWNKNKIYKKHRILNTEAEQPFFNSNLLWFDRKHSIREKRYNLLGKTDSGKILFITFTIRKNKIRIVSARAADRRERTIYAKEI